MSTEYTIVGNPTRNRLQKALEGWTFEEDTEDRSGTHLTICDPDGNFLHLYQTGKRTYGNMTRYGKNDASGTIDTLVGAGFRVIDEYGCEYQGWS